MKKINLAQPRRKEPKNTEAYGAAFQWLQDNDPLDILEKIPGGDKAEAVALAFSNVYYDCTDPKDYPGFYSPGNWGVRAAFVYGYLMGLNKMEEEKAQED